MKISAIASIIALSFVMAIGSGCVAEEELGDASAEAVEGDALGESEQAAGVLMTVCWPSATYYDWFPERGALQKTFHSGHRWYYENQQWLQMPGQDRAYWYAWGHDNYGNRGWIRKAALC